MLSITVGCKNDSCNLLLYKVTPFRDIKGVLLYVKNARLRITKKSTGLIIVYFFYIKNAILVPYLNHKKELT